MDKLKFSFRLYDVDNNGVVDIEDVTAIIETLDSIEGVKPGLTGEDLFSPCWRIDLLRRWWKPATYRGHSTESFWCFQGVSPTSRLLVDHNSLFQSIDKDLDGTLTFQEFIEANSKGSEMHRRQASVLTKLVRFPPYWPNSIQMNNNLRSGGVWCVFIDLHQQNSWNHS